MKILVTGGAGFVGSHIVDALLEDGHVVGILDDLRIEGVEKNLKPNVPHIQAPLEGLFDLDEQVGLENEFDRIIHCAARADVASNWEDYDEREELYQSNIEGTSQLLEVYEGTPVTFISTCAVYGDNDDCQEGNAVTATSPYAASKLAGEALVQAHAFRHNLPWHVLRLACVVGSRYHHGHVRDFHDQYKKLRIRPKSDGLTKKSAVHVTDVVQMVRLTVSGDMPTGVYNLASGSWSPRDTIRLMGADEITEWPEGKTHGWIGDPMAIASGNRARSAGWTPQHTIESGIKEALAGLGFKG